jgi:subtilisin family serine protease
MKLRLFAVASAALLILGMLPMTVAARQPINADRPLPETIEDLKLDQPRTRDDLKGKIHKSLADARGPQRVVVRLTSAPSAAVVAQGEVAQTTQVGRVKAQQKLVIAEARRLDTRSRVLGQTERATNVVALRIDASKLNALAKDPNVLSINPVIDYQKALSETVPYIGATAVQDRGYTGSGVRVAVLDSGIDYTHVAFGGAGTAAAYEAAYGTDTTDPRNTTLDGLFPTAKVKGGYDFVGESWPGGDGIEDPDPDPIDFEGHGTHVSDIIGGTNGVAPDVALYALKVCSAVDTACSGVALLEAMDWAIDPNGDGRTRDHVDIINMSLGSDYGSSFDDDLSLAVDRASKIGVLTVAAAGNGADKPYVAGTPGNAKTALSVAQTQVPSALAFPLVVNTPAAIAGAYTNTETVDWAPIGDGFSGDVAFIGRGCPAGSIDGVNPDDPYLADPAGKVALIDRGGCAISLKVDRAAKAGATAVLLGLVAPGDAVSFSFGGGDTFVPTMVIQQSLSNAIKAQLAAGATVNVSVSDAVSVALVGSMVGSSSRGPSTPDNMIKPEIGAPGASVSAVAGSGTGTQAFGGTSGASPMIAGSAALLVDAFPHRSPSQLKSVLMNTAETEIYNNAANMPGYLAPITRIGGGEVRVDRALKSPAAAWDRKSASGAISFGLLDVTDKTVVLRRTVDVRNYSSKTRTFKISSTFRFADDQLNKAVKLSYPSSVRVSRYGKASFTVKMTIDGRKLREWTLDSGANALAARILDTLEYDGYLWLNDTSTSSDNADPLHLAWHVLPRLSGEIHAPSAARVNNTIADGVLAGQPSARARVRNEGVGPGYVDAYSLVGTSPNLPASKRGTNSPVIDLRAIGVQTFPVPAGFCSLDDSFVYVFAINTWERTGTIGAFPGEFDIFLDTDQDGTDDYVIFNAPLNGTLDARELTWSVNLHDAVPVADAFFFADSGTNDANKVLTICGEQIGMNASNFFEPMNMDVGAFDNYFTGALTDSIVGMTVAPLGERYLALFGTDVFVSGDIPAFSSTVMDVADFGAVGTNPSETGIMLVANASRPGGVRGGAPAKREALLIRIVQ